MKKLKFILPVFFLVLCYFSSFSQKRPDLVIEVVKDSLSEEPDTISDILWQQLHFSEEEILSICSKSIILLTFSVDSQYKIHADFSGNIPALIKPRILEIFRRWSELKSMEDDVLRKDISIGKKYVIPIIFYFTCRPKNSNHSFINDYKEIGKLLQKMDLKNTDFLDFIIMDYSSSRR